MKEEKNSQLEFIDTIDKNIHKLKFLENSLVNRDLKNSAIDDSSEINGIYFFMEDIIKDLQSVRDGLDK